MFQSTPLVFQRRNGASPADLHQPQVSIHSAGLPAEKPGPPSRTKPVAKFQSAPLVFQRRNDGQRLTLPPSGRFQSTPLVFQRRNRRRVFLQPTLEGFNPLRWSSSGETRQDDTIATIDFRFNPLRWSSSGETGFVLCLTANDQVSIHSAGLPAEKRVTDIGNPRGTRFQSTPLVFQRRNDRSDPRRRAGAGSFNPLRWSSSGETIEAILAGVRAQAVSIHSAGLPAEKRSKRSSPACGRRQFQSTPLVFQRRNGRGRFVRRCLQTVSIHSAGLPAEKLDRGVQGICQRLVSIHSAGLPAEKLHKPVEAFGVPTCFNPLRWSFSGETGISRRPRRRAWVSIHSAGLPAEKPPNHTAMYPKTKVSIHSAGLPAEKRDGDPDAAASADVSIHSAGLPAEKREPHADSRQGQGFQSTPLVFQRRNARLGGCGAGCSCFNPLRWSSSGETSRMTMATLLSCVVSIHSAGLPAEKPRARASLGLFTGFQSTPLVFQRRN